MNTDSLISVQKSNLYPIVDLVTAAVDSPHSQRAYERALVDFLSWYEAQGRPGLSKATVQAYRAELVASGRGSSSVNQTMSAIRKLAMEAADNGLLDPTLAAGIQRVKGVKQRGERAGNWLTKDQAQELINTPDILKVKGLRDRAILAVMVGAGLRRSEVAGLTFSHVQQRDGRWVIVDLIGKGGRVRTVPIPSWTKVAIDEWTGAANLLYFGPVFRPINRGGKVADRQMTPQAIYNVVDEQATAAGLEVAAHDLRRTFAKLAHKGGAALDQIQLTLGHASIQTTERYLGVEQNLQQAPCDVLGLEV